MTVMSATRHLRLGTRASALALAQSTLVADVLRALGWVVDLVRIRTEGDRHTGSLARIGGTGVFVTALREALLEDSCDIAVHSLKDLPTAPAAGIDVVAVPEREDPRDVLCAAHGWTLATLPPGARVGTGSPRRVAQLRLARPDLEVVDIRGNVDTRLARVGIARLEPPGATVGDREPLAAVVLARAGLARLGRLDAVTETFEPAVMTPAPGQGAIAVECRTQDAPSLAAPEALGSVEHRATRLAVAAERALLGRMGAGCSAPVGALARQADDGVLHLEAIAVDADGAPARVRGSAAMPQPVGAPTGVAGLDVAAAVDLGVRLADELLIGLPTSGFPTAARRGSLPTSTPAGGTDA